MIITDRHKLVEELGFANTYQKNDVLIQKILEETDLDGYRAVLDFRPQGLRLGLGKNGTLKTAALDYPFDADEFWKTVDDLADQIIEKEAGFDGLDAWLDYEGEW